MAKDDYDVLVYKILIYLYAVLKRKESFDENRLRLALKVKDISEEYLDEILYMMQEENLIKGLVFTKAWGKELLIANELSDMKITSDGIHYLTDNEKMKKVGEYLVKNKDIFASLIKIIFPLLMQQ